MWVTDTSKRKIKEGYVDQKEVVHQFIILDTWGTHVAGEAKAIEEERRGPHIQEFIIGSVSFRPTILKEIWGTTRKWHEKKRKRGPWG